MPNLAQIIWIDILAASVTLFFVMDPIGNIPIFHAILKEVPQGTRIRIIFRELLIALVILLVFLFLGTEILGFLGLTQPVLNVAGGIILFVIAIRMVFAMKTLGVDEDETDPFIVPLAIPMVAGPSAITILMVQATSQPARIFEWFLALLLAWILTTAILVASPFILRVLGQRGVRALERLMGMLLILISVQMLLDGVGEYLKSYL
jgi:multiple antibiotic resistance protein